ncbi:hypothetical protein MPH_13118 [Macrophomina phaseolina MS6]|uniref:Uncharacterized protein n=1 Tax=Macrophomina phaseolina (strain MS6) TaxID=1126212 RepID=K2R6I3_MACPH|nr:hypothetical protein MPH_13118 [Macrophomina phaseolina MS6]
MKRVYGHVGLWRCIFFFFLVLMFGISRSEFRSSLLNHLGPWLSPILPNAQLCRRSKCQKSPLYDVRQIPPLPADMHDSLVSSSQEHDTTPRLFGF